MSAPPVPNWQAQILRGVGAKPTLQNLLFANDWAKAEGGSASNNPFNTTQHAPGAGSYNSVGVRNYTSPQQGIQATIDTLNNGRYQPIIDALRSGTSAKAAADALAASPWGTGSLVQKMLGGAGGVVPSSSIAPSLTSAPASTPSTGGAAAGNPLLGQLLSQTNQMVGLGPSPSLAGLLGAPRPATAAPTPTRSPQSAAPATGIAKTALTQLGTPYQWGGKAALGSKTDCSGLLQASAKANGIPLPRTTYDQYKVGQPVSLNQLQPGDAVFSDPTAQGPGHVSIYIGNGKVVEDPHTGAVVSVGALAGRKGIVGARRYG